METTINATILAVQDLSRAVGFYEALGLTLKFRSDEHHTAIFDGGGSRLWLVSEVPNVQWANYPVCVFRVKDVEEARKCVESQGGEIVSELSEDPMGPYYIFKDTEGNQSEIRQPPAR